MKCTICNKNLQGLVCANKWCGEIHVECSICEKILNQSDAYDYRGFIFCQPHLEEGRGKVEHKRKEVMEVAEHSVRSQASGEWQNGGYKTMKCDNGGRPIPSEIKEPMALQDYENGKL